MLSGIAFITQLFVYVIISIFYKFIIGEAIFLVILCIIYLYFYLSEQKVKNKTTEPPVPEPTSSLNQLREYQSQIRDRYLVPPPQLNVEERVAYYDRKQNKIDIIKNK